jgi:hypothetical protein
MGEQISWSFFAVLPGLPISQSQLEVWEEMSIKVDHEGQPDKDAKQSRKGEE